MCDWIKKGTHPPAHFSRAVLSVLIIILAVIGGESGKVGIIVGALVILFMSYSEREIKKKKKK